jgi:hypothetical protein
VSEKRFALTSNGNVSFGIDGLPREGITKLYLEES